MPKPEEQACQRIDELLGQAGREIQDREQMDLGAALGVAVREFQLPTGPCDYLLFVGRKAAGVIEAKPEGHTLTGVSEESDSYVHELPEHLGRFADHLLFTYESTGTETPFRDLRDPEARFRNVFAFHKPATLLEWAEAKDTLRAPRGPKLT